MKEKFRNWKHATIDMITYPARWLFDRVFNWIGWRIADYHARREASEPLVYSYFGEERIF